MNFKLAWIVVILGLFVCVSHLSPAVDNERPQGLPWDRDVVKFKLTDGFFAIRRDGRVHQAWDCAMPIGTPIRANFNAQIDFNWSPKAGRFISLKNGHWEVELMHLSNFETKNIDKGRVNKGDVIGYSGSSGESTGPHLHMSISYRGVKINPQEIMK